MPQLWSVPNTSHSFLYPTRIRLPAKKSALILQEVANWRETKEKLVPKVDIKTGDIIIKGGNIYTMDPNNPKVDAVVIHSNEILFAGSLEEAMKTKRLGTIIIDLEGKTMLPGFIEPHMHSTFAYFDKWVDLGPF